MSVCEVVTRYNIQCRDCDFGLNGIFSRRAAEDTAAAHINEDGPEGMPYFTHVVVMTEEVLIGREV